MRSLSYTLFALCTAMVGWQIHHSIFFTIMDFIFSPIAILKWIICGELTGTVIKAAFDFLNR